MWTSSTGSVTCGITCNLTYTTTRLIWNMKWHWTKHLPRWVWSKQGVLLPHHLITIAIVIFSRILRWLVLECRLFVTFFPHIFVIIVHYFLPHCVYRPTAYRPTLAIRWHHIIPACIRYTNCCTQCGKKCGTSKWRRPKNIHT